MSKSKYAHARKGSKKPLVASVALILVAAALIGGAFAWIDFSQSRTNRFNGSYDADVTLHDEFDGINKDIFVENTGKNIIYVRVRLDEFMKVGDTQFAPTANVSDKTTWTPHTYDGTGITDCGNVTANSLFHDYYKWAMTGAQRNYYNGTPGMVYGTLGADGTVDSTTGPNQTAAAVKPMLMSRHIEIKNAVAGKSDEEVLALFGGDPSSEEYKQWIALNTTGCWILDDTELAGNGGGWAYWSLPLNPAQYDANGNMITAGEATNLLLDEVKFLKDAEDDWIYRIDVKLQAVTLGDVLKWHDDASTCGYKLTPSVWTLINAWKA